MFGDSRPGAVQPAIASGPPVSLTIKPLPTEGRPVSFSGAVGSGFSLEVTANRSVVRVGDPIALDLKLRGNGNLEKLGLPDLSKCGLDEQQFQLPGELPAGSFNSNVKQFKLNVRVKEESVAQIPAIEFSWFNPNAARYETTRSNPIALQALAAQIVSAADVVSHSPQAADAAQGSESTPGAPRISGGEPLTLVGANLAIPNDPLQLLRSSSNFLSARWTPPLLYLAGLGLVAGAILVRWNSTRDPQLVERKQLQKRWRSRLRIAEDEPPALAAQTTASVLREFQTTTSPSNRVPIERLIADCETIAYSPDSANQTHEMQRIRQTAKAIVEGVE